MSNSVNKSTKFVDTKKLCRLCLKENLNFGFSLLDIDGHPNESLLQQIYECTTLKIIYKENYPPTICSPCYTKLEEHAKFKESVLKNDDLLQTMVENQNKLPKIYDQNDLVIYDPDSDEVLSPDDIAKKISNNSHVKKREKKFVLEIPLNEHKTEVQSPIKAPVIISPKGKQECHVCHREFKNAYTLRRHLNLHTEENLHKCEYCHKKFNDRSNYRIHLRVHTGNDLHRCVVCFKQFISPSTLKYHVVVHKKMSAFKCRYCDMEFGLYVKLESHFHEKHSEMDIDSSTLNTDEMELIPGDLLQIQMDEEDREISENSELQPLNEEEIGDVEHVSDDDLQILPEPQPVPIEPNKSTKRGIIEVGADKILLFRCDFCMEIFKFYVDLRKHMDLHKQETVHKCNKCNKAFISGELLKVHQEIHVKEESKIEIQKCRNCGKSFKSVLNLKNHLKKCSYDTEEQEPSMSSSEENNTNTRTTTTSDEEPLQAPSDTSLLTKNTLKRCEICYQTFDTMNDLEEHVSIHLQKREGITYLPHQMDRPYKCNECNKSFKRKDYLLIHIRTHTGERRYKCDICSSAFVHPSNLITHRKLHSSERPFKCELCESAFKLYAGLKIHRKRCITKYAKLSKKK